MLCEIEVVVRSCLGYGIPWKLHNISDGMMIPTYCLKAFICLIYFAYAPFMDLQPVVNIIMPSILML